MVQQVAAAAKDTIRLTWLGRSVAVSTAFVIVKLHLFFKPNFISELSRNWTPLQFSCLIGVELGLLTILTLFIFLLPAMILTWTTTLLFDYACCSRGLTRQRKLLIQNGSKLAREILFTTLGSIIKQGNFITMLAIPLCLLATFFSSASLW